AASHKTGRSSSLSISAQRSIAVVFPLPAGPQMVVIRDSEMRGARSSIALRLIYLCVLRGGAIAVETTPIFDPLCALAPLAGVLGRTYLMVGIHIILAGLYHL